MTMQRRRALVVAIVLASVSSNARAENPAACPSPLGQVVFARGNLDLRHGSLDWQPVQPGHVVCGGDLLHVGRDSAAAVRLYEGDTLIRLDADSTLVIPEQQDDGLVTRLLRGAMNIFTREPRSFEITTPFVNGTVEGTEFAVRLDLPSGNAIAEEGAGAATFALFTGKLRLTLPNGTDTLYEQSVAVTVSGQCAPAAGEAADVRCSPDGAPRVLALDVLPQEWAQWTMYYPEPVSALAAGRGTEAARAASDLREAGEAIDWNDVPGSIDRLTAKLETSPDSDVSDALHLARASAALSVGHVAAAEQDLAAIRHGGPYSEQAASLQALIALKKATTDEELQAAEDLARSAAESPSDASSLIALSYAQQANYDLGGALETMQRATRQFGADPLAWARLAELWLSYQGTVEARDAIQHALVLGPELARVQVIAGFVALSSLEVSAAKSHFQSAIDQNSNDPLARFGLGLARIKEGHMEEGRALISEAAALDPATSLYRSYLGRAYADAGADALAQEQLDEAERLDPNDPTPHQFNALVLQSQNRPVEAMRQLDTAIELNDRRGIYRDETALNTDRATRGANLGRVYTDLGFDELAVRQGTRSVTDDPSSYAAHQFLAEAYDARRRHELARASEILQAQMLGPLQRQPVDITRLQPDLNVLPGFGPARSSFNEFAPLFDSDGLGIWASGFIGNEETFGDQVSISGMAGKAALSVSQYHYQDDGFRPNSDIEHDLLNAFGQFELTPWLTVQGEVRSRWTERGDRSLRFDPSTAFPERNKEDEQLGRVGVRVSPSYDFDLLANIVYGDSDGESRSSVDVVPGLLVSDFASEQSVNGWSSQFAGIWRHPNINVTAGVTFDRFTVRSRTDSQNTLTLPSFPTMITTHRDELKQSLDQEAGFGYVDLTFPASLTWTVGMSLDSIDSTDYSVSRINPKAGIEWSPLNWLTLRAAYFRTLTPERIANQTLEPTQVAGFNQFYDDPRGTKSERYGAGIDFRPLPDVFTGVEISRRNLKVPITAPGFAGILGAPPTARSTILVDQREDELNFYLYWTPLDMLALSGGFTYEGFKQSVQGSNVPHEVDTYAIPLEARVFHPSGLFGAVGLDLVHQDAEFLSPSRTVVDQSSDFALVNLSFGYRMPDRRGIVAFEVLNLFDTNIDFYDDSFRSAESTTPQYSPEQRFMLRGTLRF
jgi:tetratricopeptide (TPR) repeat protein